MGSKKTLWNLLIIAVAVGIVVGGGMWVAKMVREDPAKTCHIGIGPADDPTLCYGYIKTVVSGAPAT